jgi:hypothetical protein
MAHCAALARPGLHWQQGSLLLASSALLLLPVHRGSAQLRVCVVRCLLRRECATAALLLLLQQQECSVQATQRLTCLMLLLVLLEPCLVVTCEQQLQPHGCPWVSWSVYR